MYISHTHTHILLSKILKKFSSDLEGFRSLYAGYQGHRPTISPCGTGVHWEIPSLFPSKANLRGCRAAAAHFSLTVDRSILEGQIPLSLHPQITHSTSSS